MAEEASSCTTDASVTRRATVTNLITRRRDDVLRSITFVFGGINYGTVSVRAPYIADKPFALYLVSSESRNNGELLGPLDGLITDDLGLALKLAQ